MRSSSVSSHRWTLPSEYQQCADDMFYAAPDPAHTLAFADLLGVGGDYRKIVADPEFDLGIFLDHFQHNMDLLIQKTWVLSSDEYCKDQLRDRIPGFVANVTQGRYRNAVNEFSTILSELAYLFFGEQSYANDFCEWVFRIDDQIGLFWWYGQELSNLGSRNIHDETLKSLLLIGLSYLTNF